MLTVLDDFAGPGGWDEGLKMLGEHDVTETREVWA